MTSSVKMSLVFLTFNEITGLKSLWPNIQGELSQFEEVFAVDGGSNDGTLEFFEEHGISVHGQDKRGRGEAFRVAFAKASGDALLFYSPDGNEDAADLGKFRIHFENGADMVIATRMTKDAHNEEDEDFLKWRKWANNFFNIIANWTWNRGEFVTDSINGYRAISRKAWKEIQPDGEGYTIEYQSTIRAFKKRLRIVEFPTYEANRIDDQIGSPSLSTGLAFVKAYFRELSQR